MASGLLIDYLGSGPIADRPVSPGASRGGLYTGSLGLWYATDTDTLSAWDGSTWEDVGGGSSTPPVVTESGTNLAATGSNNGNYTRFTNASAKTYTFDGSETFLVSAEYHGRNVGAGDLTITEAGGMTINPPAAGTLVIPQGGTFTVKIVAADEADLFGVTVAA